MISESAGRFGMGMGGRKRKKAEQDGRAGCSTFSTIFFQSKIRVVKLKHQPASGLGARVAWCRRLLSGLGRPC